MYRQSGLGLWWIRVKYCSHHTTNNKESYFCTFLQNGVYWDSSEHSSNKSDRFRFGYFSAYEWHTSACSMSSVNYEKPWTMRVLLVCMFVERKEWQYWCVRFRLYACLEWLVRSSKHAALTALKTCTGRHMQCFTPRHRPAVLQYNKERALQMITIYSTKIYCDSPERTVEIQLQSIVKKDRGQLRLSFPRCEYCTDVTFDAIKCSSNYTTMQ